MSDANEVLLEIFPVLYLGGHPSHADPVRETKLFFQLGGVSAVDHKGRVGLALRWEELRSLVVPDHEMLELRAKLARSSLAGLFVSRHERNRIVSHITASDDRGDYVFEVPLPLMDLRARMSPVLRHFESLQGRGPARSRSDAGRDSIPSDITERLATLARLLDEGVISEREHEERRAEMLREI